MRLVKDSASVWETYMVEGYPLGIEKIDRGAWYAFRLFGQNRIYFMTEGVGKERAKALLAQELEEYKSRIIVGKDA